MNLYTCLQTCCCDLQHDTNVVSLVLYSCCQELIFIYFVRHLYYVLLRPCWSDKADQVQYVQMFYLNYWELLASLEFRKNRTTLVLPSIPTLGSKLNNLLLKYNLNSKL